MGSRTANQYGNGRIGELIVAIQKWKRHPSEKTVHDIASEVADVELMLGQLQYMMDTRIERKYCVHLDDERKFKRTRLRMRLKAGQQGIEQIADQAMGYAR